MVRGLAAGDIDVIVSSHDPQDADVKRHPFAEAADGAIGLETLLRGRAAPATTPARSALLPLLRALTINPAKLLGLPSGRLEKGAPADLILVDLGQPWVVDKDLLARAPRTRPSTRARCRAACCTTMVAGKTVYQYAAAERA